MTKLPKRIKPLGQERPRKGALPVHDAVPAFDPAKLLAPTTRVEYEAAVVAGAVSFSASRFMGRGRYDSRPAATLAEARALALLIAADAGDPSIGRILIYAINAAGRQVLVEAGGKPVEGLINA